ncbi:MAG: peptidase [Dehalococcoidia bacterium]|nr:peptidase [Dehalococcoidia bacterium]
MLFFLFDILFEDPGRFMRLLPVVGITMMVPLILGLTVHEFAHALAAHMLGDDTAKRAGRLSLNPIRHMDPTGTLLMLLAGFGWGKPVPVDPRMLPNFRRGMAIVAAAGPASNLLMAALLALPIQLGLLPFVSPLSGLPNSIGSPALIPSVVGFGIFFNLMMGIFNLLPIAPLDGSKVLMGLAPSRISFSLARFEHYGIFVLLIVFAADSIAHLGIFWTVVSVPADFLGSLFVGEPFL